MRLGCTVQGLHYRRVAEAVCAALILSGGWTGSVGANEQELKFGLRLCTACEQKLSTVADRYFHIDHQHGGKFLQRAACGQTVREAFESPSERHVQAVREEGDEHVRLDPFGFSVEHRTDRQIALQGAEGFFDLHELQIVVPQLHRIGLSLTVGRHQTHFRGNARSSTQRKSTA
jgi:hypothetical protein